MTCCIMWFIDSGCCLRRILKLRSTTGMIWSNHVKSQCLTSGNATVPKKGRRNQMEAVNSHEQSTKVICPFRARPQLVRGTKGTTSESSNCPSFSDAMFWMKFLSQYIAMVWNELDQMFLTRKIPVVKTCSPSHCKMLLHDYIKIYN